MHSPEGELAEGGLVGPAGLDFQDLLPVVELVVAVVVDFVEHSAER